MRLLKIGRDASCDIVLHSQHVSSLHAELTMLDSGDITIEDKGSHNGTYVMNQRIQPGKPVSVRRGDLIRFADVDLQWSQVPMPEDNSAYRALYGIGSHFNNDIQISGSTVSRYHATVKIGKDGKFYIVDHSKNGTTVDGIKIPANNPYRLKKKNTVVCGGVPVDLSRLPWPTDLWKYISGIAAAIVVIICAWILIPIKKEYDDGQLYAMYNNAIVYLEGIYHFHVTGVPVETLERYGLPANFYVDMSKGEIIPVESFEQLMRNSYSATGFFVSKDGKIITNLHVAKPWLYNGIMESVETIFRKAFASKLSVNDYRTNGIYSAMTGDAAYITQLKIVGVLDQLVFVPQGRYYSSENAVNCRVLSAGNDPEMDVALIQSDKGSLPEGSRFVNVVDSMDVRDEILSVGERVYTIGFPSGQNSLLQKGNNEKGIQVIGQGGHIIQQDSEYDFGYNAATTGGASGSPVFNKYGMLIGVHHAGLSRLDTQGYNYGIKAKYVKKIIEEVHKVK